MPHPSVGLDAIIEHAVQKLVLQTAGFGIGALFGTVTKIREVERQVFAPVRDVPPAFQEAAEDVAEAVERLIRRLFG